MHANDLCKAREGTTTVVSFPHWSKVEVHMYCPLSLFSDAPVSIVDANILIATGAP
jgi:hypothetical protein